MCTPDQLVAGDVSITLTVTELAALVNSARDATRVAAATRAIASLAKRTAKKAAAGGAPP